MQEKKMSAATALTLLWAPLVVGAAALLAFRNLYGVAVLFAAYAVNPALLARRESGRRRWLLVGFVAVLVVLAAVLVIVQGQL
jgi:hypothetical protein